MAKNKKENSEIKSKTPPKSIKEKITDLLQLPSEVVLNLPRISIIGNKEVYIENYKGIIEYKEVCIRINTNIGIVRIGGRNLTVKNITSEDICVLGVIEEVEFIR